MTFQNPKYWGCWDFIWYQCSDVSKLTLVPEINIMPKFILKISRGGTTLLVALQKMFCYMKVWKFWLKNFYGRCQMQTKSSIFHNQSFIHVLYVKPIIGVSTENSSTQVQPFGSVVLVVVHVFHKHDIVFSVQVW